MEWSEADESKANNMLKWSREDVRTLKTKISMLRRRRAPPRDISRWISAFWILCITQRCMIKKTNKRGKKDVTSLKKNLKKDNVA